MQLTLGNLMEVVKSGALLNMWDSACPNGRVILCKHPRTWLGTRETQPPVSPALPRGVAQSRPLPTFPALPLEVE